MPDGPIPPIPGLYAPTLGGAPRPGLCTDCGISRMGDGKACGRACQFIAPDYAAREAESHGRTAQPDQGEEAFFGVTRRMLRARMTQPLAGAQWTGITTALAARPAGNRRGHGCSGHGPRSIRPMETLPVIVTDAKELAQVRGMRMGFGPTLALLEPAAAAGHRRIALVASLPGPRPARA